VEVYSAEFMHSLETEIVALPDSSALSVAMRDYLAERDRLRECRATDPADAFVDASELTR